MSQHILHCNDQADILLLDLPASIAHAQASVRKLCSVAALETPYITPEPKGRKREALLAQKPADDAQYHADIQTLLRVALRSLREQWYGSIWCQPRVCDAVTQAPVELTCLCHLRESKFQNVHPPLVLSPHSNSVCCSSALANIAAHNPDKSTTDLIISTQGRFLIPPRSTFLCTTIEHGVEAFEQAVACLLPQRSFDLILLDPPWSNRSVRRSRTYSSAEEQLLDPFGRILPLVSTYLDSDGYLAIWITNKAAIRAEVLNMCCSRNLVLVEEWIWLKVTINGEPVTPLDGIWRQPYEVLLLFRRSPLPGHGVVRRVSMAVPDVHSRKPSLKSLFEQLLPLEYHALEVFARSLTTGWWSWGDEVLKFQHESNWH